MLYYLSNADIPGKKAHAIQQMKMCQAFVRNDMDVCFVHPSYGKLFKKVSWKDIADYYGLTSEFEVKTIPSFQKDNTRLSRIGLLTRMSSIAGWIFSKILTGDIDSTDTIYSRNYYPTFLLNEFLKLVPEKKRPSIYFERHHDMSAHLKSRFYNSLDGVICITHALKKHTIENYGTNSGACLVAPDGVDLRRYQELDQEDARRQLGLPLDEKIVMYTGHLYPGKGGSVLAEVADDIDAAVYIVGGYSEDIERIRSSIRTENVTFTGFIEPANIPLYQVSADVLVAPYTWDARQRLSPLKLFEYMATGNPIVASQLPVLEEVLTDSENVVFVEPGKARDLLRGINDVLNKKELSKKISENARSDVQQYGWGNRAARILTFINDSG